MRSIHTNVSGWGRYPTASTRLYRPERYRDVMPHDESCIARGCGRSYGDASFDPDGATILMTRLDRLLELDTQRGVLRAEAGATVDEVLELLVPRGWFLPVVPGTRHVTLGGCAAADVHGKNQHRAGCFGDHIQELELILADGSRLRCSPQAEPEVFQATIGGMGLTGIIGELTIRLQPIETASVQVTQRSTANLAETFAALAEVDSDAAYTVAWLDCLAPGEAMGRGVVTHAEHAPLSTATGRRADPLVIPRPSTRRVPVDAPGWVLNRRTMALYNRRYLHRCRSAPATGLSSYHEHFFPLDRLAHWNRLYGRRGFLQYQFLLPADDAPAQGESMLRRLIRAGHPPFLAVLKRFARSGLGLLSFAQPGYTLALDFPFGDGGILAELRALDEVVIAGGGRVYLAKDARLEAHAFRAMYPRFGEWLAIKRRLDPGQRFRSGLSRRLRMQDPP